MKQVENISCTKMNYLNPEYQLLECTEMNEKINRIFRGVI